MPFTCTLQCAASNAVDHVASVCVCVCVCACVHACAVVRMCVFVWTVGGNEEALCLFIMTSWLWQKLEKMPGVSEWNSSAWRKCEFVSVCVCVCPSLGHRSPPGLCERKSNRQRQKQNLTNSNMKQRAGHLAAARLLVPVCETFKEREREREREKWEKTTEKEGGRSRKLQKGFRGQFSLQAWVMLSGLRMRGLYCIMGVLGMSS